MPAARCSSGGFAAAIRSLGGASRGATEAPLDFLAVTVLIEPGHLDGFEDLLVGRLGVVGEARQLRHVTMQVREPHRERVELRERLAQRDPDVLRVPPLHHPGISTTTSPRTTA